ncbi:MAG: (2Fe-2S) ferredoxin domain-containing protein [Cyanobacteria bacterium P01_H01_bin.58]
MPETAQRYLITVCQHRSCSRSGAAAVLAEFQNHQSAEVMVSGCDCQGQCGSGPTVRVMPGNSWYCQVKPEDVQTIVNEHCQEGRPVKKLMNPRIHQPQSAYANMAAQYQAFMQDDG